MALNNVQVYKSEIHYIGAPSRARRASLNVKYKGNKIDDEISSQASSFTYTDNASGQSDSISANISNADKKWMNEWMPNKGDKITSSITLNDWASDGDDGEVKCGEFIIDDLSFAGRPLTFDLAAVSAPANEDFTDTPKNCTYENTTVKEIASKIANSAGLSLHYEAPTIRIAEIEQSNQTDSTFLYSLCTEYGLAMKIYCNKLVIFNEAIYEAKQAVATIDEKDMENFSCNTTIKGTYTGAKVSYTLPDSEQTISMKVGKSGRMYQTTLQVSSGYDAELKASAIVNNANKKATTMQVKIMANPKIIASSNVNITGLGKFDGKYYVDKVVHSVGSKYTMSLELHKVQERIGAILGGNRTVESSSEGHLYIVKKGDNLWALARQFYGQGRKKTIIYEANKEVIERVAKEHGFTNSNNGWWIFPGTELYIPKEV